MKIEVDIPDALVNAIADAVISKFKAEGGSVTPKTGDKADKADKTNTGKKADTKTKVKREDVLAKVRELGEAKGKPAAKEAISKYAAAFGDVKDEDLPKLLADVEAALAAEETATEEDDF